MLDDVETFFCSEQGCTCHEALYPVIRRYSLRHRPPSPRHIPTPLCRPMLAGKYAWNRLLGRQTYERAWMLDYADRPIRVDTSRTRQKLQWSPETDHAILKRLPVMMRHYEEQNNLWETRNLRRNKARYAYHPDDG